ncbi:hypothetical protein ACQKWADRAFT_330092 [Trichoderma austrokoningii]
MLLHRFRLLPVLQTLVHLSSMNHVDASSTACKSTLNEASWPSITEWNHLNESVSGRLIHPLPPALACHFSDPGSNVSCADIQYLWSSFTFHQNNPVSTAWNNMNNDSCLPTEDAPCSGLGYPVYVVNATTADHVKQAIDFARKYNVRLNIKASGHDYLKRSASPYSLSIWTRYMSGGYELHSDFKPKGCSITINTTAVTAGAASYVSDIYSYLDQYNLTVVDGMGPEVTMGGYLTGGGHSPLSNTFGLGSDQVYEVEMVTPQGQVITANECQNTDLFWAVRGGGGGTFGVLTKVTVRTVPSKPMAVYDFTIEAKINSTAYWDSVAYIVAQYPTLAESNIAAFTYLYPNTSAAGLGGDMASFEAVFALYDPSSSTTLESLLEPYVQQVKQNYSTQIVTTVTSTVFPNFHSLFLEYADDKGAGVDKVVGSWLLPPDTLKEDAFSNALVDFLGPAGGRLYLVSGAGVWNAKPRGGSDAVNPAWRKALVHAVTSQQWAPLDEIERSAVEHDINNVQVEAFRKLAPDSGAYLNEAYWNEPDFQRAFWGSNYERLRDIKKTVDPDNVFWCHVCVGNEGYKEVGHYLCPV